MMNSSSAKQRKLAVLGAYGGANLGDEAILYSVIACLREAEPEPDVTVLTDVADINPATSQFYEMIGVRSHSFRSLLKTLVTLLSRDLVIGGGQLINPEDKRQLLFLGALVLFNRLTGNRPSMVGVGVEGRWDRLSRMIAGLLFRSASVIGCRDQHSFQDLIEAGLPEAKLKRTADVVFSQQIEQLAPRQTAKEKLILLVIHRSKRQPVFAVPAHYAAMIRAIVATYPDHSLAVVAHDTRPDFDAGLVKDLAREFGRSPERPPNLSFHADIARLDELLTLYAKCQAVISARMHPLIFGAIYGARLLAISESRKIIDLAGELSIERIDPQQVDLAETWSKIAPIETTSPVPSGSTALARLEAQAFENFDHFRTQRRLTTAPLH